MLVIEKGKIVESVGVEMADGKVIKKWQIQGWGVGHEGHASPPPPFSCNHCFVCLFV